VHAPSTFHIVNFLYSNCHVNNSSRMTIVTMILLNMLCMFPVHYIFFHDMCSLGQYKKNLLFVRLDSSMHIIYMKIGRSLNMFKDPIGILSIAVADSRWTWLTTSYSACTCSMFVKYFHRCIQHVPCYFNRCYWFS
jgi:hypothetical protein